MFFLYFLFSFYLFIYSSIYMHLISNKDELMEKNDIEQDPGSSPRIQSFNSRNRAVPGQGVSTEQPPPSANQPYHPPPKAPALTGTPWVAAVILAEYLTSEKNAVETFPFLGSFVVFFVVVFFPFPPFPPVFFPGPRVFLPVGGRGPAKH